jgi:hypothetical protein
MIEQLLMGIGGGLTFIVFTVVWGFFMGDFDDR